MSQPLSPPSSPIPGAIYTEDLTGISWVWTGVAWIEGGPSSNYSAQIKTGMALTPGFYAGLSTSQPNNGGSNLAAIGTQYGTTTPTNPSFGQLWIDTSNPNSPITSVWIEPGEWKKVSDGVTNAHVEATQPATPDVGDTWLNTTDNSFQIWNGTNWIGLGGGTSSVASSMASYATQPAVLTEGSIYFNTTSHAMFLSDGTSWVEIDTKPDDDTNSIVSLTQPITRIDKSPLQSGDQWIDSTGHTLSYYNGSVWTRISSATVGDTHSFYETDGPTARPDGSPLAKGDVWIDSDDQAPYVWNSSLWTPLSFPDTVNTNSIVTPNQPVVRLSGSALIQGDLWINDTTFAISYWSGTQWLPTASGSSALADTNSIFKTTQPTARADGSTLQAGDLWTNSANSTLYYHDSSSWQPVLSAFNNNSHSFYSTAIPTAGADGGAPAAGDQWVNSATNKLTVYTGSAWTPLAETPIDFQSGISTLPTTKSDGTTTLAVGDIFHETAINRKYFWDGSAWKSNGSHNFISNTTPPASFSEVGDTWVNSTTMTQFVRFDDGTTIQWVQIV